MNENSFDMKIQSKPLKTSIRCKFVLSTKIMCIFLSSITKNIRSSRVRKNKHIYVESIHLCMARTCIRLLCEFSSILQSIESVGKSFRHKS